MRIRAQCQDNDAQEHDAGQYLGNNVEHMCGYVVPLETQYAMKLSSSQKIVVQYGRLDNRQTNLAYYTTMAF